MDSGTLYQRTVESWTDRVLTVDPDQWAAATPCLEWDVRALVNHVVGEDLWTEPLVHGATIQEVGDRFDGDLLGSDPRETALDAAERASRAVAEALPGRGKVHLSYGDEDMEEYVVQLAADHLIHGWDLAAATGGDTALDADLVTEVAAWFASREDVYRSAGAIGARAAAADDPQSQLLAAFGRDPGWSGRSD
ncbi:MAG TPA: TIGR03086 family metal-binding protein [Nocardioides sp.]|nr:TIGR03086 family metal-binding protein [Nocardioides sp.]